MFQLKIVEVYKLCVLCHTSFLYAEWFLINLTQLNFILFEVLVANGLIQAKVKFPQLTVLVSEHFTRIHFLVS
jgi:hypothetical protein